MSEEERTSVECAVQLATQYKSEHLIYESPFVKTNAERDEDSDFKWEDGGDDGKIYWDDPSWQFVMKDPKSGEIVEGAINPLALFESLRGEYSDQYDLVTCTCWELGCAGFETERYEMKKKFFLLEIDDHSFFFDRRAYEMNALRMLREIYETKRDWHFLDGLYTSYENFKADVDKFLADTPRMKQLWDTLDNIAK